MLYSMKNTLPLLKEVAEDIYLLSIPVPLMKQVNCYLISRRKRLHCYRYWYLFTRRNRYLGKSNGIRGYNRKSSADTFSS